MAIARRPKAQVEAPPPGVDVEALIAKGGSVGRPTVADEDETAKFTLRVPVKLLGQLDTHLKRRTIKTPRQLWILEAIVEKLERESGAKVL